MERISRFLLVEMSVIPSMMPICAKKLSTFLAWFTIPASFYIASRLLIPEFPVGTHPDLEQRFSQVRVPFFACLVLSIVPVLPGLPGGPPSQWLLAVFGGLALIGMLVPERRWHVALLCAMSTAFLTFLALARTSLGG